MWLPTTTRTTTTTPRSATTTYSCVHIREEDGFRGKRTVSAYDSATPFATYSTIVSSGARRALWSLCHTRRQDLQATEYRHLPRRTSGTEETVMSLGDAGDDCINVLSRVTTVLNTDLESVTTELDETQDKLLEAHARIRQLEAQLAGRALPLA